MRWNLSSVKIKKNPLGHLLSLFEWRDSRGFISLLVQLHFYSVYVLFWVDTNYWQWTKTFSTVICEYASWIIFLCITSSLLSLHISFISILFIIFYHFPRWSNMLNQRLEALVKLTQPSWKKHHVISVNNLLKLHTGPCNATNVLYDCIRSVLS